MFLCFFLGLSLCSVHYYLDFCSICQFSCLLKPFPAFEGWEPSRTLFINTSWDGVQAEKHIHEQTIQSQQQVSAAHPVKQAKQKVKIPAKHRENIWIADNLHLKQWNASNNKEKMCDCTTKAHLAYGTVRENQQLLPLNPLNKSLALAMVGRFIQRRQQLTCRIRDHLTNIVRYYIIYRKHHREIARFVKEFQLKNNSTVCITKLAVLCQAVRGRKKMHEYQVKWHVLTFVKKLWGAAEVIMRLAFVIGFRVNSKKQLFTFSSNVLWRLSLSPLPLPPLPFLFCFISSSLPQQLSVSYGT